MVNKTEKSVKFSLRTIKICRFIIIDGIKYVYCIKHAYKFLLREQLSRLCGRSLTLASRCFLSLMFWHLGRCMQYMSWRHSRLLFSHWENIHSAGENKSLWRYHFYSMDKVFHGWNCDKMVHLHGNCVQSIKNIVMLTKERSTKILIPGAGFLVIWHGHVSDKSYSENA